MEIIAYFFVVANLPKVIKEQHQSNVCHEKKYAKNSELFFSKLKAFKIN